LNVKQINIIRFRDRVDTLAFA